MEFSYYGRLDDVKPKKPVAYSMIDEYIKKRIDKEINIFKKEMPSFLEDIKKELISNISSINSKLIKINQILNAIEKPVKEQKEQRIVLDKKEMDDVKEKIKKRGIKVS